MKREYRNEIDKDTGEACEFSEDEKVVSACSVSSTIDSIEMDIIAILKMFDVQAVALEVKAIHSALEELADKLY